MEVVIQNDAHTLYIVNSAYLPITGSAQVSDVVDQADETAFGGMADQEDPGNGGNEGTGRPTGVAGESRGSGLRQ